MAIISPFKGYFYKDKNNIKNLTYSPQGIKGTEESKEQLPAENVKNLEDTGGMATTFFDLVQKETIIQDENPYFYFYIQSYVDPISGLKEDRTGIIGNTRVYDWEDQMILRHEAVISRSLSTHIDRLKKDPVHLTPVHGFYTDTKLVIDGIIKKYQEAPDHILYDLLDDHGIRHILGRIHMESDITTISRSLIDKQIILADGHHRYTATLKYCNSLLPAEKEKVRQCVFLSNTEGQSINILPIHRLLTLENISLTDYIAKLEEDFYVEAISDKENELLPGNNAPKGRFGISTRNGNFLIELKPDKVNEIYWNFPEMVKALDLTILHYFLIEKYLKIKRDKQTETEFIKFSPIFTECIRSVKTGETDIAVFTRPVTVDELKKVCFSGYTMPQKSTWFYPKVISGLVFASVIDE